MVSDQSVRKNNARISMDFLHHFMPRVVVTCDRCDPHMLVNYSDVDVRCVCLFQGAVTEIDSRDKLESHYVMFACVWRFWLGLRMARWLEMIKHVGNHRNNSKLFIPYELLSCFATESNSPLPVSFVLFLVSDIMESNGHDVRQAPCDILSCAQPPSVYCFMKTNTVPSVRVTPFDPNKKSST